MNEAELLHDARSIGVDRLRRDEEPLGDLARAEPLGRERENLLLAGAQILGTPLTRRRLVVL